MFCAFFSQCGLAEAIFYYETKSSKSTANRKGKKCGKKNQQKRHHNVPQEPRGVLQRKSGNLDQRRRRLLYEEKGLLRNIGYCCCFRILSEICLPLRRVALDKKDGDLQSNSGIVGFFSTASRGNRYFAVSTIPKTRKKSLFSTVRHGAVGDNGGPQEMLACFFCTNQRSGTGSRGRDPFHLDNVSEWLRSWSRKPVGSAREGSNPFVVVFLLNLFHASGRIRMFILRTVFFIFSKTDEC